jgi:DNA-binding SARP family transcriptional activator
LVDLFWPEDEPSAARHSLRTALSALRRELDSGRPGVPLVQADHFSVGLNSGVLTTDVEEFKAAVRAAAAASNEEERLLWLTRADERYAGELLPGFYEGWIGPEQHRLEELYYTSLQQLLALREARGELELALSHARRAVQLDPLREEGHRELIRLLVRAGEPRAALRQYGLLEQTLRAELGSSPSPTTHSLLDGLSLPTAAKVPSPGTGLAGARRASHEPPGGAMALTSPFYVARAADGVFHGALSRGDSIVLLKGARQVGKSSLLARGADQARTAGSRVALTSLQRLLPSQLETLDEFLFCVARLLAEQLQVPPPVRSAWDSGGANLCFWSYFRDQVLASSATPLVWALDDVDRLFTVPFGEEVFALFRSWHNERAFDPAGPWGRLTLAIAFATEAHLFVRDLNQSPFNVGTRIELEDFTQWEVAELNRCYDSPLGDARQVDAFFRLVGGHPHLVRSGLHELVTRDLDLAALEARADSETGPFGSHLRRMFSLLSRDRELCAALGAVLQGKPCPTVEGFYRLRSAGVILGETPEGARLRCTVYARYLSRRLAA